MTRHLATVSCAFALCWPLAAGGAEPTSEELWRRQPPPFKIYAEGMSAPADGSAAREMRGFVLPWLLPPLDPSPRRVAALEEAASHSAMRMAAIGLRAPRIHRRDGVYPIYLVRDLGGSAAQYGPGFGEVGITELRRIYNDDWDRVVIVGEAAGFGSDMPIFPEQVASSVAHELFHGVQASYAHWSGHDKSDTHEQKWVTEGLPEAIGEWSIQGLPFMGGPPFHPRRRFASGNPRFGMALGMRPYDYPLDMRIAPMRMPIYPKGDTPELRRQMASYMTSSFWSYAWDHSMPAGKAWTPMSRALLLRTPQTGTASLREDSVAWTHQTLARYHPAWTRGLYDALPAFIPWWVAFPDEVMRSRRGEFAHSRWLGHAFIDGCPLYELNEANPTATFKAPIRELAAYCVRVKWTGASVGRSGWPAAALIVVPADGGGETALSDLHLGLHGTNLGKSDPYNDPKSGLPSLAWGGLSLDPRHPMETDGEAVITFTNVARDPLATTRRIYEIHLGMATATVTGQLDKPAEEGFRPASRVRVGSRRSVQPGVVVPLPPGDSLSLALTPSPAAGKDDCSNATAKTAGLVALGMDKAGPAAGTGNLMSICLEVAATATRESLRPARQPDVELKLPAVPDGHTGPIEGGEVVATWNDPDLGEPGVQHVHARTRDVQLQIEQANPAFVRGRFLARFSAPADTANGELRGDFVAWRAPTDQRLAVSDPLDYASSDLLQTFAAMGRSPEDMRAQLGRRKPPRQRSPSPPPTGAGEACPMDCAALREGKVSQACRQLMPAVYEACPQEGQTGQDEILSLAAWLYRDLPEPMRSELVSGSVDAVMAMPSAIREDWARKIRAQREAAGN